MRATTKLVILLMAMAAAALAQSPQPDCTQTFTFTSATAGTAFSNKPTMAGGTPCIYWQVDYWTNGASGVSVKLEGSPDAAGVSSGSYTALTATSGTSNPMTGTTQGTAILCCDYYPWLRVNPTTFTGTNQTMIFRVYGWRAPTNGASAGGAASNVNVQQWGGTSTTLGQKAMAASVPVVLASDQSAIPVTATVSGSPNINLAQVGATTVLTGGVAGSQGIGGLAASGATAAGNPVPAGGVFLTTQPTVTNGQAVTLQASARGTALVTPGVEGFPVTATISGNPAENLAQIGGTTVLTGGTNGSLGIGGLAAAGAAPSGNPIPQGLRDSAGNMVIPDYCTLKATFTTSGTGNLQIIAATAGTIRVCHVDFSGDTLTTAKLTSGTGANCVTGTADETGVFTGIGGAPGFAMDYPSPLPITAAKALCINLTVASTGGGTIIYSQR